MVNYLVALTQSIELSNVIKKIFGLPQPLSNRNVKKKAHQRNT